MATDRSSYFPDNVLEPIFDAPLCKTPRFKEIYVGIDPASHNSSTMGLAAIGVHEGTVYVFGIAGAHHANLACMRVLTTACRCQD